MPVSVFEKIHLTVPSEWKMALTEYAKLRGESPSAAIISAMEELMARARIYPQDFIPDPQKP